MQSQIIKLRSWRFTALTLLVCQWVALGDVLWSTRIELSDVKTSRWVHTFSTTRDTRSTHRKRENQNRATRKPSQILPDHHPEKLVKNTPSLFGPASFWFDLRQSIFDRLEGARALRPNFFILNHLAPKRAPPWNFSFA